VPLKAALHLFATACTPRNSILGLTGESGVTREPGVRSPISHITVAQAERLMGIGRPDPITVVIRPSRNTP